ncbi:DUF952 domain-containing protein [Radicibacter daui]|uniref:DUF952 domain-containing protein n=1 Tax=Radicibacter daui TaxID=3064829 RepID=UPI004046BF31
MSTLYKIVPADLWEAAEEKGVFTGAGIDLKDGFIHLSTGPQVPRTLARFFAGQEGLVLVAIDAGLLEDEVLFEGADGEMFPHLYGTFRLPVVIAAYELRLDAEGKHILPAALG